MELELSCARGSNRGDRRRLRRLSSLWSGDAHCVRKLSGVHSRPAARSGDQPRNPRRRGQVDRNQRKRAEGLRLHHLLRHGVELHGRTKPASRRVEKTGLHHRLDPAGDRLEHADRRTARNARRVSRGRKEKLPADARLHPLRNRRQTDPRPETGTARKTGKPSLLPHRRGGRVQELPGVSRLVPGERPPQTGRRHGVPPLRQWRRSARRTDRSVGEERSQRRRHQRDAGTRTDF